MKLSTDERWFTFVWGEGEGCGEMLEAERRFERRGFFAGSKDPQSDKQSRHYNAKRYGSNLKDADIVFAGKLADFVAHFQFEEGGEDL